MKRMKKITLFTVFAFLGIVFLSQPVSARTNCSDIGISSDIASIGTVAEDATELKITVSGLAPGEDYSLEIKRGPEAEPGVFCRNVDFTEQAANFEGEITFVSSDRLALETSGRCKQVQDVFLKPADGSECFLGKYRVRTESYTCTASISPAYPDKNTNFTISVSGLEDHQGKKFNVVCPSGLLSSYSTPLKNPDASGNIQWNVTAGNLAAGNYQCEVRNVNLAYCLVNITIFEHNEDPDVNPGGSTTLLKPEECDYNGDGIFDDGIQTALGCFPTDPGEIVKWFLKYAIMAAGGVGFLRMLYAAALMMLSAGDPEKLKEATELFTSAIIGIILVVFSLFAIRFLGYGILRIPGFS